VYEFTERLINPHPPRKAPAPVATPKAGEPAAVIAQPDPVVARAQAIFKASEEVKPYDPADFDFALGDEPSIEVNPTPAPAARPVSPLPVVEPTPSPKPARKRYLGMTAVQLAILIGLALILLCIIAGFVIYFSTMA
jgi:hypothetical protein